MKRFLKYFLSVLPVFFLILFLAIAIRVYGIDALSGPSQLVLIFSTGISVLIAMLFFHTTWKVLEEEINHSVGSIGSPIVILLLIGMLSGTWMVSGVVPMLIYYGMQMGHGGYAQHRVDYSVCYLFWWCDEGKWNADKYRESGAAAYPYACRTCGINGLLRHLLQCHSRRPVPVHHAQRKYVWRHL
jgi:hypothetical protein